MLMGTVLSKQIFMPHSDRQLGKHLKGFGSWQQKMVQTMQLSSVGETM